MGYDGTKPVAGIGKHWERANASHPPPGRAYLMGWWEGHDWIQKPTPLVTPPLPGPHGAADEEDYGTTTLCVWDQDPTSSGFVVGVGPSTSGAVAA
jgi:hypothetical protein